MILRNSSVNISKVLCGSVDWSLAAGSHHYATPSELFGQVRTPGRKALLAPQPVLHYLWWLYWAQPLILQFLLWRPFSFAVSLHILQLGDAPEIGVDGHKLDLRVVKKNKRMQSWRVEEVGDLVGVMGSFSEDE